MVATVRSSPNIVLCAISWPVVSMRRKRFTCIGKHLTPKATKRAAYTRQLFATRATKREVPRPKAFIDLGKLRKVIWLRLRLRFAGI
jgi:hypothetical protein